MTPQFRASLTDDARFIIYDHMFIILARDNHYSLLRESVNYGHKSFITLGPGKIVRGPHAGLTFPNNRQSSKKDE